MNILSGPLSRYVHIITELIKLGELAGINQAIRTVEETAAAEMEKITGQMNLPGMPGGGGFPGIF